MGEFKSDKYWFQNFSNYGGLLAKCLECSPNGVGDMGSLPGRVTKDSKNVLDATLLITQYYKVRVKGKVEQSRERCYGLPYSLV